MHAFRCDKCEKFFNGAPEMQVKTNKMVIAINYGPDSANGGCWYTHDLCPDCAESFRIWWCMRGAHNAEAQM